MDWNWDFTFRAIQAVGTIALGGGALWIGCLKWRDDREKLRQDLWLLRIEIYQQALVGMAEANRVGLSNWKPSPEFKIARIKAEFAFRSKAPFIKMTKMLDSAWGYDVYLNSLGGPNITPEQRKKIEVELKKRDTEFGDLDSLDVFKPELVRKF